MFFFATPSIYLGKHRISSPQRPREASNGRLRSMRIAILGLVFLLALGANGGGCSNGVVGVQDYGSVAGRVLDATTNQPIANALISVGSLNTATADTQGAFVMTKIPIGEQTVTARSAGFTTATADVEVSKDQTAQSGFLRLVPVTKPESVPTLPAPATPTPAAAQTEAPPSAVPSPGPSATKL